MRNSDDGDGDAAFPARNWAEIDLEQVRGNIDALARRFSDVGGVSALMPVVKADAYGHGAVPIARACVAAGVRHLAVAGIDEAIELRRAGIAAEIHVLSPFLPIEADAIVRNDLTPMVSSRAQWDALVVAAASAPLPARCFLIVDTGMGREGCLPDEALALWKTGQNATTNLRITGLATHFACADESDPTPTESQSYAFAAFVRALGPIPGDVVVSVANSPAALRFPPEAETGKPTLVRAGAILYGIEPYRGALNGTGIRPLLTWRARVTLVRDLPAGVAIGYGWTHTLERPSRIATIAAGYADGLPRRWSNVGSVLLRGNHLPIVGRVSMDQCQIDATDLPEIAVGDTVTLIGRDGAMEQSVLDVAEQIETTPHEPTCALTRRVPRRYLPLS